MVKPVYNNNSVPPTNKADTPPPQTPAEKRAAAATAKIAAEIAANVAGAYKVGDSSGLTDDQLNTLDGWSILAEIDSILGQVTGTPPKLPADLTARLATLKGELNSFTTTDTDLKAAIAALKPNATVANASAYTTAWDSTYVAKAFNFLSTNATAINAYLTTTPPPAGFAKHVLDIIHIVINGASIQTLQGSQSAQDVLDDMEGKLAGALANLFEQVDGTSKVKSDFQTFFDELHAPDSNDTDSYKDFYNDMKDDNDKLQNGPDTIWTSDQTSPFNKDMKDDYLYASDGLVGCLNDDMFNS
jgi:hypothetical protein